jgi:hypothetical protein
MLMDPTPMARLALAAPAAALLFLALPARAQVVTVNTTQITRKTSTGTRVDKRSTAYNPEGINRSDCIGPDDLGLTLTFPVSITAPVSTNQSLRVFASVNQDCVALTQRSGQNPQCWAVTSGQTPALLNNVDIRAQDIVSQVDASSKTVDPAPATKSACLGKSEGTFDITLYFIILQPGGESQGTPAKYGLKAKVTGPAPPTGLTATAGSGTLFLNFTPQVSNALIGYKVFLDDGTGSVLSDGGTTTGTDSGSGTVDAGATADAGDVDAGDGAVDDAATSTDSGSGTTTDSGGSSGGTCSSSTLVEGVVPDGLTPYFTAGSTGASLTVKGLTDGKSYAVALAAQDTFDNTGPLSNVACATPVDITDFYDRYRAAGGKAGGGYCSTGGVGLGGGCGLGAAAALIGLALVRRRRERS